MSIRSLATHPDVARRLSMFAAIAGVGAALVAGHVSARPAVEATARPGLTVVELFTSQGCSSCPPANANLTRLAGRPDVLALSFGVTYWDQLGWPDTFADPAFTARQRAYQTGLDNDNVWTPQVVVDGRADVVGQDLRQIETLIAAHRAFTGPALAFRKVRDRDAVGLSGGTVTGPTDIWLVRYDPRVVEVPVRRGENGGRTLPHANVVRELVRLGRWEGRTVGFALPAPTRPGLSTAVLVQEPGGGRIVAAARA
ncbi:thioredoxin family protein [Brevundimonas sp.]|uniref:DUF1223 domain-containing protein n=1 Tax=Brevundimonas sp. TaxID=1871086 RepID=UPI001A23C6D6|nr:DUF1223 domain-containing protein [Brevundimonas sp.]MBJ7485077.1 DUF1223 domain-containing protein [Brevundimonas sp.]